MFAELLRRSAWLAAGSAFGRLLPLLVLLAASRRLDPGGFATASAGFAWAGVAMSLSSAGLATVMAQRLGAIAEEARQRAVLGAHLRRSLAASALLGLIVALFGAPAAGLLFSGAVDTRVAVPAAIAGALWSQVAMVVAALNGSHRARAASATLALCGLLQGGAMALALLCWERALAMAWGMAAGSAVAAAVAAWQVRLVFGVGVLGTSPTTAEPPAPGATWRSPVLWHTVASASVLPVSFFASAIVSRGPGGGRQLALFFALEQVYQLVVYLPAVMGQALLPMVSRSVHGAVDGPTARQLVRRLTRYALLAAVAGLGLAALATLEVGWFTRLLGNPAVQPGDAWAVRWMAASASLAFSLSLLGGAMLGRGQIMRAGQLNLMWGLLFVGTTMALGTYGTAGLQCARTVAAVVLIAATAALLQRPVQGHQSGPGS